VGGCLFKVVLTKKCSNNLVKQKKEGSLSDDDFILIRTWISEMSIFGPDYIESCGNWNDHELKGDRIGQRSSSFSSGGRIIYKVKNNKIEISVVKITAEHN